MEKLEDTAIRSPLAAAKVKLITWTLLSVMPLMGMAIDLITPSLPAIAHDLHVAESLAKNLIGVFLLGYAFGNIFIGILADSLGRQKLLRLALITLTLASLLPLVRPSIEMLYIARILQGLAVGAITVFVRVIPSDIMPAKQLINMAPIIGTAYGIGPIIGPVIGGYLQSYFGWHAAFYFLSIGAFIATIALFIVIPETHFHRKALHLKQLKSTFGEIISNKEFLAYPLIMGFSYSLIISFHTIAPFLIQDTLKLSPIFFGHLALFMGLSFLVSTLACRYALKRLALATIMRTQINAALVLAIIAVIMNYIFKQNVLLIGISSAVMFFTTGILFSLAMGKGLSLFSHISGTAMAVMYLICGVIYSLVSFLISAFNIHSQAIILYTYLALILICRIIYSLMLNKRLNHKNAKNP